MNSVPCDILIVGSGFSGLGMAIQLKRAGYDQFLILERANDLGGVWRDNSYPGCACDVESHLYSFSFDLNPDWSRQFASRDEIWSYLKNAAKKFGILPHIQFSRAFLGARWDAQSQVWQVQTSKGDLQARIIIGAAGALNAPAIPEIPGLTTFSGRAFHSSEWDHTAQLEGKRLAVIGTGASAIQIIPCLQEIAGTLHVFQRTPAWVLPRKDYELKERRMRLFRKRPFVQKMFRFKLYWLREKYGLTFRMPKLMRFARAESLKHMHGAIQDSRLRAKLTPNYTIGCKRVLLSDDYYPSLGKPNVEVVTEPISKIEKNKIITNDGRQREVDAIIFASGFRVTEFPLANAIFGLQGRSLADIWAGSAKAYAGSLVSSLPNCFFLLGPNSGLGHNSVVLMAEAQMQLVLAALSHMKHHQIRVIKVKQEAESRYVAMVDRASRKTVWLTGCKSWYLDRTGRNATLWPKSVDDFRKACRFRPDDFDVVTR